MLYRGSCGGSSGGSYGGSNDPDDVNKEDVRADPDYQTLLGRAKRLLSEGQRGWRFDTQGHDAIEFAIIKNHRNEFAGSIFVEKLNSSIEEIARLLIGRAAWDSPPLEEGEEPISILNIIRKVYKQKHGREKEWPTGDARDALREDIVAMPEMIDYANWAIDLLRTKHDNGEMLSNRREVAYLNLAAGLGSLARLETPIEQVLKTIERMYMVSQKDAESMRGKSSSEVLKMLLETMGKKS